MRGITRTRAHTLAQVGALVSQTHMERVLKYIAAGKQAGIKCLFGGSRLPV
jgi:acyl-CoA reductase-like NAD-dependent aldehyde dehydrogenase